MARGGHSSECSWGHGGSCSARSGCLVRAQAISWGRGSCWHSGSLALRSPPWVWGLPGDAGTRCAASPLPVGLAKCRPSPWGRHGAGSILGALAEQLVIIPYTARRWLRTAISASSSTHGSFL